MPVPPSRSDQPIVIVEHEPREPAQETSRGERAMLIAVAVILFVAFVVTVIYPHTPFASE
jgi:hypothetical protein